MATIPNDPLFALQWYLQNSNSGEFDINVVDVWDDYTGAGIQVTVVEGGFQITHDDLNDNVRTDIDWDYFGNDDDPNSTSSHGTSVMGIIGAEEGNGYGGVGIAWDVDLVGLSAYSGLAYMDAAGLGNGVGNPHGADNGTDVINASYGITGNFTRDDESDVLPDVTAFGRGGLGTNLTHANGNERAGWAGVSRQSTTEEQASSQGSISVNALRLDGWVAGYSTPGSNSLISAFAEQVSETPFSLNSAILTTDVTGAGGYSPDDFAYFNGTSAAAPQLAGIVALILEANPDLGWRDVQEILAYSARHVGSEVGTAANTGAPTGGSYEIAAQADGSTWFWNDALNWNGGPLHFSNDYGYGLVDTLAAVRLAETWQVQQTSANQVVHTIDMFSSPFSVDTGTLPRGVRLSEDMIVEHVSLNLVFSVDDINDMAIYLTSPDGTRVELLNYVQGAGGTVSYSTGAAGWDFGVTAFMGTINEGATDPSGTGFWTLTLENLDGAANGAFSVTSGELTVSGRPIQQDALYVFTDEYSEYAGIDGHATAINGGTVNGTFGTFNAAAVTTSDTTLDFLNDSGLIDGVAITATNISQAFTGDGDDTVTGDTVTRLISTGRGADSILGGSNGERIDGGRGADIIDGGGGNDTIIDGVRTDTEGDDTITGGAGDDLFVVNWVSRGTYDGGLDTDTLDLRSDNSSFRFGSDVDLSAPSFTASFFATFSGFENALLGGGLDNIIGSDDANTLVAGKGDDTVSGGGGNDVIHGDDLPFGMLSMNRDGVTDQAAEVSNFDAMPTGTFTVEFLYRGTAAESATNLSFFSYGVSNSTNEFLIYASATGTITVWMNNGSAFDTGVPVATLLDGEVHRVSVSVNPGAGPGGRVSFYIDGVEEFRGAGLSAATTGTGLEPGGTIILGQDQDGSTPGGGFEAFQRMVGEIGDIRIWSTERDAEDIAGLAFTRLETVDVPDHLALVANWQLAPESVSFIELRGGATMTPVSAASNPFEGAGYTHDPGNDSLDGGAENDTILAGGGDDTVMASAGSDVTDGGEGTDTYLIAGSAVDSAAIPFLIDLAAGSDNHGNSYRGIERVTAGIADDLLRGTGGQETLDGGAGDDTVEGRGGDDSLIGGTDTDTLSYASSGAGVVIGLASGFAGGVDSDADGDVFEGFENAIGSGHADILIGDGGPNRLTGGGGLDRLFGEGGSDTLEGGGDGDTLTGGAGDDTLDGGGGVDRAEFGASPGALVVDLGAGTATGDGSDTLIDIENALGGAFGDRLTGANFVANSLDGGAGNDTLAGRGGNDTLNGNDGDDSLLADSGDDSLDGGGDRDTVSFQYSGASVIVNLEAGTASGALTDNDTLERIENVTGSGAGDLIYGTNLVDNRLEGGDGNDRLYGLNGNDTLEGGSGADLAAGGAADDEIHGGDGEDTLDGNDGADVLYGGADNDTLRGGGDGDTLIGGAGEDRLEGGAGGDNLSGGSFADRLEGGLGDDTIDGGSNFDTVLYIGLSAAVQVNLEAGTATGGGGTDVISRTEHVYGSGFADILYGTQLHGNRIEGSLGNDTLYGLDGRDTLLGGNDDDRLLGGSEVDRLLGGAGNDFLDGGSETDFLTGGPGADNFVFRSIADTGVGQFRRDEVRDFDATEGDVINLFLIDANETAGGNQAFSVVAGFTGNPGELTLLNTTKSGVAVTIASMDVDGDGAIDGQVYIVGTAGAGDFIL